MGKKTVTRPDWLTRTLQQRFDEKWTEDPIRGCWLWNGTISPQGYGAMSYKLNRVQAQRISWFLKHGVMPASKIDVCHKCDVRNCVNPDHLFLGTRSDNMMDAISKGRKTYPIGTGMVWTTVRELKHPLRSHCLHGHMLDDKTIYIDPKGHFSCKECRRLSARKHRGVI